MIKNKILFVKIRTVTGKFTIARFLSAAITIIIVAFIKYWIWGNFTIEYSDLVGNVSMGLIGWTINTGLMGMLTEYLDLKGINFNLNQFLFGLDTMKMDGAYSPETIKSGPKVYNAMESDGESGNTPLDKGKSIDRQAHPFYKGGEGTDKGIESDEMELDKSNEMEVDKEVGWPRYVPSGMTPVSEPPFATWYRLHPGVDPRSIFFPKKINPGPGFNVPGGEIPIRDDICQYIDWNSHFLSQWKRMDLETAIDQKKNYLLRVSVLTQKLNYAQEVFNKIPEIPRTEHEFNLKNQILKDIEELSINKTRTEARVILVNSRIEFIEIQIKNNNNNNTN
jgi:hypothetical protein